MLFNNFVNGNDSSEEFFKIYVAHYFYEPRTLPNELQLSNVLYVPNYSVTLPVLYF